MKNIGISRRASNRGFTLVESIISLVLLGIASAAMIGLYGNIFNGLASGRQMEVGAQMVQECAERLLAVRKSGGFNATVLTNSTAATAYCNGITLTSFNAPVVTLTNGNSTSITACPTVIANSCKLLSITQGGLTPVTLLLVDYN